MQRRGLFVYRPQDRRKVQRNWLLQDCSIGYRAVCCNCNGVTRGRWLWPLLSPRDRSELLSDFPLNLHTPSPIRRVQKLSCDLATPIALINFPPELIKHLRTKSVAFVCAKCEAGFVVFYFQGCSQQFLKISLQINFISTEKLLSVSKDPSQWLRQLSDDRLWPRDMPFCRPIDSQPNRIKN